MNLQFTGYYDDNGVEIYFGDAVRNVEHQVDFRVEEDTNGEPVAVLIIPDGNGYFPYSLNSGKGYIVIATTPIEDFTDEELN